MTKLRFYLDLVKMLGFLPVRLHLYRLAFLPRSAMRKESNGKALNNERLEYLGDSILDAVVSDYLFKKLPDSDEGKLTQMRARIVKRKNLNYLGAQIGIPEMIEQGILQGNASKHLHGNILEAFIGAAYMDRGYHPTKRFIKQKLIKRHIELEKLILKDPDYKSRLIEWTQKKKIEISFSSKEEYSHERKRPDFISTVKIGGEKKGKGRGSSKKEAEQQASKAALKNILAD